MSIRSAWPVSPAEPSQKEEARATPFTCKFASVQKHPPFRCLGLHQDRIFNAVITVQGIVRLIAVHPPVIGAFAPKDRCDVPWQP